MPEPRVGILDVTRALRKLGEAYPSRGRRDEVANVWIDVLADLSPRQLERAVLEYMRTDTQYMPAPGQLLALVSNANGAGTVPGRGSVHQTGKQKQASIYHAWEQSHEGPCPVCGARLEALTPEERGWNAVGMTPEGFSPGARFGVLHHGERHRLAGIPAIGEVTA